MKRSATGVGVACLSLALALGLPTLARAGDWPRWRGPEGTGHVPAGAAVPTKLAAELAPAWSVPVGEGFASPVVAGGKVYYLDVQGGQETLHALEAATGKERWQAAVDSAFKDGWGQGPRCAPVADGPRVFAQSCKGELVCLSSDDGKVIWRTSFVRDHGAIFIGEKGSAAGASRHGNTGAPLVDGDRLIAQVGSAQGASLVAFEKATGKVVWKSQNDQTAYAAPLLATIAGQRQVIAFTIEGLIALDPSDGRLLWRVPLKTALGRHVTTPVVAGDTVMVASHQVGLVGIKVARTGDGWTADTAWSSKQAGQKDLNTNFASPVGVGEHLYGLGSSRNLYCVAAATGKLAWSKTGLIASGADKAHVGLIVMGQSILTLTDAGELVLFAAEPAAFREVGRAQVCGQNWCNPAYADGKLYLRDARKLYCVPLVP